jgi:hypothetical protein
VDINSVLADVDRDVRIMQEVVDKIFLDNIALISEAHDEIMYSGCGINFHDMPENGHPTDLDHRLRPDCRLFPEPAAETAGNQQLSMQDIAVSNAIFARKLVPWPVTLLIIDFSTL